MIILLIATSIKEGKCCDAWKKFARHHAYGSCHTRGIYFYDSYSPVAHAELFRINIFIEVIHRLTAIILDVSNYFQNENVPIYERVCVSPPPYYLYWFEKYHPNIRLNKYDGTFCIQCMNGIQETKPAVQQFHSLFGVLVTILKYRKRKIDHTIYIKVFYLGTFPYLIVSTDDIINTTNN